ncbi:MAG: polysaccharide deacetylase family protein [Immundisolibacteraceae bacterium]|nr:polysaccharide deacetylase family protein [Immundisolibacteraceae bacterium]
MKFGYRLMGFIGLLLASQVTMAMSAVVLQYHRIGETGAAITRTSLANFQAHLDLIERFGLPVLPLPGLLKNICAENSGEMPESGIAITFDDAHISVYEQAWPALKARGWPFTVFVNTAAVDGEYASVMDWHQLQQLVDAGVIIGNHSVDHRHLSRQPEGLNQLQWRNWTLTQITTAQQRIDPQLGTQPKIFAYPYGEYDQESVDQLKQLGYSAFGQQSGAIGCHSNLQALPRFPVSGVYANPESVELKLLTLPFPLDGSWINPVRAAGDRRPQLELKFHAEGHRFDPASISCFATGQGAIETSWDQQQGVLSTQAAEDLPVGRSRYNCTVRNRLQQRYHWFSQPWFIPDDQGQWPAER